MDERLAVETELDRLPALGLEPGSVGDVVVDAVEGDLPRLARSSRARSLVPRTRASTRGWAAIARTSRIAVGVSIIAQIGIGAVEVTRSRRTAISST
jgi:hypothetical protein